jgi:hypothetical protein
MNETYKEQLDRVRLMAAGDDVWDLSDNDVAALVAVVKRLDALEKALADQQHAVCSWCEHRTERAGRSPEEMWADLNEHVMSCPKRPEAKLMSALLGIIVPLGIDMDSFEPGDTDGLILAIDKRWKEVLALIPEPAA